LFTLQLLSDDKILFEAADKNKDGSLNKAEFLMFSHPEEHPDMLPVILKQTLQDKDTDGDGFISFQEFIGDRGKAFHHFEGIIGCLKDSEVK
jgi:Ca2+-binding EF-hand superfamily protein